jgi:glutaminase
VDENVCESEAATIDRNRGIARLLDGYGRMYCDPDLATGVYARECSVRVSARDLAAMGATLANGGQAGRGGGCSLPPPTAAALR